MVNIHATSTLLTIASSTAAFWVNTLPIITAAIAIPFAFYLLYTAVGLFTGKITPIQEPDLDLPFDELDD